MLTCVPIFFKAWHTHAGCEHMMKGHLSCNTGIKQPVFHSNDPAELAQVCLICLIHSPTYVPQSWQAATRSSRWQPAVPDTGFTAREVLGAKAAKFFGYRSSKNERKNPSIPCQACQAVWNGSTIVAEWTHKIGSIHFLTANDFDPYPVQLTPAFKEWRRAHGPFLSWLIGLEAPCAFETIGRKLLSKRVRRWTQLRSASLSFAELLASLRLLWASCVWFSVSASVHAFLEGSTRSRLSSSMLQVETFLPGQCVPWMIRISWALFYHISRVWCGMAFSII